MSLFSFPNYLDASSVSELENSIIDICNTCKTYDEIKAASAPIWDWTSRVLQKPPDELRHEIETHETDEVFPDDYREEKDHLLKIPLLLLEKLNH